MEATGWDNNLTFLILQTQDETYIRIFKNLLYVLSHQKKKIKIDFNLLLENR